MRAVSILEPGDVDVLEVLDRHVREPGAHEVRIEVRAAAVNPTDTLLRAGGDQSTPAPWVPGMDAAGVVESVGPGVERIAVGDEVMAVVFPRRPEGGAQAEVIVVPVASVVPIPTGASFTEASTLPMNGLTAIHGLDVLGLARGDVLAVSGGAGLLASYVIPIAKERGLRVLADARPQDEQLVRGFGADVVVPRSDDFASAVRAELPEGVDGLFDTASLGGAALGAVREGGAIIAVRGWDDTPSEREIQVTPIMVRNVLDRTDWLFELQRLASAGALSMRVASEHPPEQIAEAHRVTTAGGLRGRAVIVF
jgi:NADPH:quinone reductase-like Zn-dependent oxidoreductase